MDKRRNCYSIMPAPLHHGIHGRKQVVYYDEKGTAIHYNHKWLPLVKRLVDGQINFEEFKTLQNTVINQLLIIDNCTEEIGNQEHQKSISIRRLERLGFPQKEE